MAENTGRRRSGPARHIRDVDWLRQRVAVDPATECWVWQGTTNHRGYGLYHHATDDGIRTGVASRLALELKLGRPIGPHMNACHHCDNPPCVNLEHLFEGTTSENALDSYQKQRRPRMRGERNGHAKLRYSDLPAILAALAEGETQGSIAKRYGVNQSQISRIKNGKAWPQPLEASIHQVEVGTIPGGQQID